jgi:hypothetical protein
MALRDLQGPRTRQSPRVSTKEARSLCNVLSVAFGNWIGADARSVDEGLRGGMLGGV